MVKKSEMSIYFSTKYFVLMTNNSDFKPKALYSFCQIPSLFLEGSSQFISHWDNLKPSIILMNGHFQSPTKSRETPFAPPL